MRRRAPPCSAAVLGPRALRKPHIIAALRDRGVTIEYGAFPSGQIRRHASRLRRGLSLRQQRFVEAYLVCGNATEAARRIGLGERNAQANGARLLARRGVAEAVAAECAASMARTGITRDRLLEEYARIGFALITDVVDWGDDYVAPRASDALAAADAAAIAEISSRPGKNGPRIRVKMYSKLRALNAMARLLGIDRPRPPPPAPVIEVRPARDILHERLARLEAERAGKKKDDAA
jgi:phage terminase small subunit